MSQTSKTLRRYIGLYLSVCLSVRPFVCLSVKLALDQEPLEIGSRYFVCGTRMKIKETRIFLVHRICHSRDI